MNPVRIYQSAVFVQLCARGRFPEVTSKVVGAAAKTRTLIMRARSPASRLPGLADGRSVPPNGPAAFQRTPPRTPPR
jgi:hypothetical protein